MKLIKVVRQECISAGAEFANKADVLRAISRLAKLSPELGNVSEQDILAGLKEREELGSTGFGKGVAIPHCRMAGIESFVVGIVTVPRGVDFDSLDDEPVRFIAFIIGPEDGANTHIKLLSAVSQTLGIKGAMDEMIAQKNAETLRESFLRFTRDELDDKSHQGKSLFHVFIQDENHFRDILQFFSSRETTSVAVLETECTGAYLSRMPLFAGFWSDDPKNFSRLIVAVISKKLANETIRGIEDITGDLDKAQGVMVTIQDLFYAAGSLEA